MKRFHQLNTDQQESAVKHAKNELKSLIKEGVVLAGSPITDRHLDEVAQQAAEDAYYSEPTDMVVADIAE
jgi:hypothetical protein